MAELKKPEMFALWPFKEKVCFLLYEPLRNLVEFLVERRIWSILDREGSGNNFPIIFFPFFLPFSGISGVLLNI